MSIPQYPSTKRLFLGHLLNADFCDLIEQEILPPVKTKLQGYKIRWQPRERWHITLHFLGSVDPLKLDSLIENLTNAITNPAFERLALEISRLIAFPQHKPRVVALQVKYSSLLEKLHHDTQLAILNSDLETYDHPHFLPHITLGKHFAVSTSRLRHAVERIKIPEISYPLPGLTLFESCFQRPHTFYLPIYQFEFFNRRNT